MYQKIYLTVFLFICVLSVANCQENKDFGYYTHTNFEAGYSYNFDEPNPKNFHLLSVGINKTTFGGRHGGGYGYGIGTDIGLNTENFTIAPKINGFIYYQFIVIGSELALVTDLERASLRYVPIIGIGNAKLKITFNPHVILTNKSFQPINRGAIQVTFNFSLNQKERKSR